MATTSPNGDVQLGTLLLCDLVDSTRLIERLGDTVASEVLTQHDTVARGIAAQCRGRELNQSDGFLFGFERPFDAVLFALRFQAALAEMSTTLKMRLMTRIGIHVGEFRLLDNTPEEMAMGAIRQRIVGIAVPMTARIMSLAAGGQTLLTKAAFDIARQAAVGVQTMPADLQWLAHGPYSFKGIEEPIEIFEVGVPGVAPLKAPANSEKVKRAVSAEDEITLGWRPAVGLEIPGRPRWFVRERLGEGGFGEVWLAVHEKSLEKRVFKFCFEAERLRSLKREAALFRLLRDTLGEREDIARLIDWQFDTAPYFLESEHSRSGSLLHWKDAAGGIGSVPLAIRIEIVARVAVALGAAHSVGVLHRDIKPSNVLIAERQDGTLDVRLTDFGIGTVLNPGGVDTQALTNAGFSELLTQAGETSRTGTRLYAAPERIEGKPPTVQADIYSLGVMLYQMIAGHLTRPLSPGWEKHIADPLLREDIAECVAGNPDDRLPSAMLLAERLRHLPQRHRARARAKFIRVAAAASIVLAIVAVSLGTAMKREERLRKVAEKASARELLARQSAERFINFMVRDLFFKVRDLDRTEILLPAAKESVDYFKNLPTDSETTTSEFERARSQEQVGVVYLATSSLKEALAAFQASAAIRTRLSPRIPGNPQLERGLLQNLEMIARTEHSLDNQAVARAKRDEEITLARRLLAKSPTDIEGKSSLALALAGRAEIAGEDGEGSLAEKLALEAETLSLEIRSDPTTNTESLRIASDVLGGTGDSRFGRGMIELATRDYQAGLAAALRADVAKPNSAPLQTAVAKAYGNIGALAVLQGRSAEAEEPLRRQWQILAELASCDKSNLTKKLELSTSERMLADVLWRVGKASEALGFVDIASGRLTELITRNPRRTQYKIYLAICHRVRGNTLDKLDRHQEARAEWEAAIGIVTPIANKSKVTDLSSESVLAVCYLLLGRPEDARPHVEAVAKAGPLELDLLELCKKNNLHVPAGS